MRQSAQGKVVLLRFEDFTLNLERGVCIADRTEYISPQSR